MAFIAFAVDDSNVRRLCDGVNLRVAHRVRRKNKPCLNLEAMLLSKGCEYGLRAALYLVTLEGEGERFVSIRTISEELGISFHFLTKTFQKLTDAEIMESQRGPKGGIALARPVDEVTLLDLVLAIDGPALFEECVLGLPECGNRRPCPIHKRWADQRKRLRALFAEKTLQTLAAEIQESNLRLADVTA